MSKAMLKKLLSFKSFDDVIKMQSKKHAWLLARQGF